VALKLYRGRFTVFGRIGNGVEGSDSVMGRRSWEDGDEDVTYYGVLLIRWTKV
jgi:hypothetical protein